MKSVTLPWPPSCLSPNSRRHWTVKAKAAAKARRDAAIACQMAGIRALGWPALHVTIEFRPPDRRRRDADNMLASIKPHLDGLADASGVDDSLWTLAIRRGDPVKHGAVGVTVEAAASDAWRPVGEVAAQVINETARKRGNAAGPDQPQRSKGNGFESSYHREGR